VTLVSLKPVKTEVDGTVKAEFSDGSSLIFSTDYLPGGKFPEREDEPEVIGFPLVSALGDTSNELSPEEEESFRFAAACFRVEKFALRLIARAEQHSMGLTAKLQRRFQDIAVVRAVISCFLDRNLLDDHRYAELWIRSRLRLRKALSPRSLLMALQKKGIDRDSSGEALREILDPETEYALLLKYLDKTRFPPGKARFLRGQLRYEGFSSETLDRYFTNSDN